MAQYNKIAWAEKVRKTMKTIDNPYVKNVAPDFDRLVRTWERAFIASLGCRQAYQTRLSELKTWDKPRHKCGNCIVDYEAKITALQNLLL